MFKAQLAGINVILADVVLVRPFQYYSNSGATDTIAWPSLKALKGARCTAPVITEVLLRGISSILGGLSNSGYFVTTLC